MPLTTRQKFSLIFSIYVSIFVALVGAIFFLVLHTLLIYQIQKDTSRETANVLKNNIAIEKNAIVVIRNKTRDTLSEEVIESNVSILLLDNDLKVIKAYGLLELYKPDDQESVKTIAGMAKDVKSSQKSYTKMITWRGQNLSLYMAPVKNSGKSYGIIVAAKSLAQTESLEKIILIVLAGLAAASALASLFLSRLLVGKIFKPIRTLTEIISKISLDKLNNTLTIPGSKSDELVILSAKFNEMMLRLRSMSEQQKEFIANTSHELKTPLSRAISTFDLSISTNKLGRKTLTDIKQDLFEINDLLDKLMFLSRLKPGMILPSDKLSLNKSILECAEIFKKDLRRQNKSMHLSLGPDTTVLIPKEYAKVLLSNLLSNAAKYGQKNSVIAVRTQRASRKVTLSIINQGPVINKLDLRKIGERFYRGGSARKIPGHGIGLSIVRRIADLYKINFSIKSEAPGTEVILKFPVHH